MPVGLEVITRLIDVGVNISVEQSSLGTVMPVPWALGG